MKRRSFLGLLGAILAFPVAVKAMPVRDDALITHDLGHKPTTAILRNGTFVIDLDGFTTRKQCIALARAELARTNRRHVLLYRA